MSKLVRNTLMLIVSIAFLLPLPVDAGQKQTVEGRLVGLNCVVGGRDSCPTDNLDAHIAYEPDFVLHQGGAKYYLLLDLPRAVKVRHINEKIRVTGEVKGIFNAIKVDTLEAERKGKYEKVWSRLSQWEEWKKRFYRGPPEGS